MKAIINIVLLLVIVLLAYMVVSAIKEPIAFNEVKSQRRDVVVNKLKKIRKAQEVHRMITGKFAGSFDSLAYVLNNDSIATNKLLEDPEDPGNPDKFTTITTYSPAIDSIKFFGITNADSLRYVPYSDGKVFSIDADTMTYQSTLVSVTEVFTRWDEFMGKYASVKYSKYDSGYDPKSKLKFGDMSKPNLGGNWER